MSDELRYQSGFASHFETQALPGALPIGQNSPQQPPMGLYAEQLSGSAFTAPRAHNRKCWLYRLRPSVLHRAFEPWTHDHWLSQSESMIATPNQLRWDPLPPPTSPTTFIQGLITWSGNGNPQQHSGATILQYVCNQSMDNQFFYNADGEMLIVPQLGSLQIETEMGRLEVEPSEIIIIPRGVKFQVNLQNESARGYVLENHGAPFVLPELGPIGANGLANPRDFLYPSAHFYDVEQKEFQLDCKYGGTFWRTMLSHHPLDVVAWHGNLAPCKYDLKRFNTIGSISFDHPDPSIFTVLTSPTNTPGVANVDFVIFPDRWMVAEHTFRPPYYHRNIMSEFMGLIEGIYDAKPGGFMPGGASLHNCMAAHGPDAASFEAATTEQLTPFKQQDTLAFMFESFVPWKVSQQAMNSPCRQNDYHTCWQGLKKLFPQKAS